MTEKYDDWRVRNVHPDVKKQVRLYSVEHGISVAQALKEFVELALAIIKDKPEYGVLKSRAFMVSGDLKAARTALNKKVGKK